MDTNFETVVLDETTSTQDEVAKRLGSAPLLVVARSQTRGRGRSGADWANAPRAVAASLGFRPIWPTSRWPLITLVSGVAAVRALRYHPDGLTLKWPNDLMRGDEKLGGILTEAGGGRVITGWGANLYWPDPPCGWGAIFDEDPGVEAAVELGRSWAGELLEMVSRPVDLWPHEEYRRLCSTLGRLITWVPDGRGRAVTVSPQGGLEVATARGPVTLTAGEVTELRHGRRDH
ncbi:MAG: biotin--[acetyl-CoA-carboxylase] ligase [Acidimicrobiia bacterium]|nr:biotin--[acetyl-CoA-carboxylase] ligase [Acidimicrobiia bacterium]